MKNDVKKEATEKNEPHHEYKYYSLDRIKAVKAQYNLIIGERSNGKTYACLLEVLKRFIKTGEQGAYVRRYKEDFRGKRGESLFSAIVADGHVSKLTDEKWDRISYYSGRWYLAKYNELLDKVVRDDTPIMYGFSLNDMEHDKSTSYPKITIIIFDEFLTRQYYMQNEFVIFMNVLSTIIRLRDNVTIYMLGNTVNKYCPYFKEMGLSHVAEMEIGKIDVYNYGESKLKVAVEMCGNSDKKGSKKSNVYFAFDNPSLAMITGGAWEIDLYPHLMEKYSNKEILLTYFIVFDGNLLQCEIIQHEDLLFTYIHQKTTEIRHPDEDIIFTLDYSMRPNVFRNILKAQNDMVRKIRYFYANDRVFYQDNEVGEIVRNYLNVCKKESISK